MSSKPSEKRHGFSCSSCSLVLLVLVVQDPLVLLVRALKPTEKRPSCSQSQGANNLKPII
jgi:hypothetical protein